MNVAQVRRSGPVRLRDQARAGSGSVAAVRHFGPAVGETVPVHRVSDRAERRARAYGERAA